MTIKSAGVYFVQCAEFIKIGCARDVVARLRQLRGFSPHEIQEIAWIPSDDPVCLERDLHWQFREHAHYRERFRDCAPLRAYIAEHGQKWPV